MTRTLSQQTLPALEYLLKSIFGIPYYTWCLLTGRIPIHTKLGNQLTFVVVMGWIIVAVLVALCFLARPPQAAEPDARAVILFLAFALPAFMGFLVHHKATYRE
jgi:hypothetical protein